MAVDRLAVEAGLARLELPPDLETFLRTKMYQPVYRDYVI